MPWLAMSLTYMLYITFEWYYDAVLITHASRQVEEAVFIRRRLTECCLLLKHYL